VSVLKTSTLFACAVFLTGSLVLSPRSALAQNQSYCDGYARDYAQRNSTGHVARGAARGAIGGGLIGGIIGGGKGLGVGALIGAGTGAIVGSDRKSRDYNALYHSAFSRCMRG
jgi:outer membrane lipoprotein SlyB